MNYSGKMLFVPQTCETLPACYQYSHDDVTFFIIFLFSDEMSNLELSFATCINKTKCNLPFSTIIS